MGMATIIVIAILALCLLAPLLGVDSTRRDAGDRGGWQPRTRGAR